MHFCIFVILYYCSYIAFKNMILPEIHNEPLQNSKNKNVTLSENENISKQGISI